MGREVWVEKMGRDGKADVYYLYDSTGRLMRHRRGLYGYDVTPAEYERFGEDVRQRGRVGLP